MSAGPGGLVDQVGQCLPQAEVHACGGRLVVQAIAQREWWHRLQYSTTIVVRAFGDDQPEGCLRFPSCSASLWGDVLLVELNGNPRR